MLKKRIPTPKTGPKGRALVADAIAVEGLELTWGPCWLGYREIVVARVAVAA